MLDVRVRPVRVFCTFFVLFTSGECDLTDLNAHVQQALIEQRCHGMKDSNNASYLSGVLMMALAGSGWRKESGFATQPNTAAFHSTLSSLAKKYLPST
jgi:hypothetical protein